MPTRPRSKPAKGASVDGYTHSMEHLADEFRCLDLRIERAVLRFRQSDARGPRPPEQLPGLTITDREIDHLLGRAIPASALPEEDPTLVEELSALENRLRECTTHLAARRQASLDRGDHLPLAALAGLLNLTRFEESCLIICLAPEIDRRYEKLYAYLQDDVTRRQPSVDLLLDLLCDSPAEKIEARIAFDPQAPLRSHRLLTFDPDAHAPLLSRIARLDDRIASYLLGSRQPDPRLVGLAVLTVPRASDSLPEPAIDPELGQRLQRFLQDHLGTSPEVSPHLVLHCVGPDDVASRDTLAAACRGLGLFLLTLDLQRLVAREAAVEDLIHRGAREALLQPAVLCFDHFDALLEPDRKPDTILPLLWSAIRRYSPLTVLLGTEPGRGLRLPPDLGLLEIPVPAPPPARQRRLWEGSLRDLPPADQDDIDLDSLVSQFHLTATQIRAATGLAIQRARWQTGVEHRPTMAELAAACRAQSHPRLGALAAKIEPRAGWHDIVLPPDSLEQLHDICRHARHRQVVIDTWGFGKKLSRGTGLTALFSGPPGTGKTMAAEVLAGDLRLDLYRIDLSQVVSKYIGDTEKNLRQIFREAAAGSAILFFDEADALFGRRSEVRDAHDRYANIEVGYLLQEIEQYEGISILATNLRGNMDDAFARRMRFIVEFPFPDEADRRRIWSVLFPSETPLDPDIDFGRLARDIRLSGGNLKNIALSAAFQAAADGGRVRMEHLLLAARREHEKLGRSWE